MDKPNINRLKRAVSLVTAARETIDDIINGDDLSHAENRQCRVCYDELGYEKLHLESWIHSLERQNGLRN